MYAQKEKIYPTYVAKDNSNCEKQVVFFLIMPNGEKTGGIIL